MKFSRHAGLYEGTPPSSMGVSIRVFIHPSLRVGVL